MTSDPLAPEGDPRMALFNDDGPGDDEPLCWWPIPGGGSHCGLEVDHNGDHGAWVWSPLSPTDTKETDHG